jgi:hypothetical protein
MFIQVLTPSPRLANHQVHIDRLQKAGASIEMGYNRAELPTGVTVRQSRSIDVGLDPRDKVRKNPARLPVTGKGVCIEGECRRAAGMALCHRSGPCVAYRSSRYSTNHALSLASL